MEIEKQSELSMIDRPSELPARIERLVSRIKKVSVGNNQSLSELLSKHVFPEEVKEALRKVIISVESLLARLDSDSNLSSPVSELSGLLSLRSDTFDRLQLDSPKAFDH